MAKYPVSVNIKRVPLKTAAPKAVKPVAMPKPSKAATQSVLKRAERMQAEEAGESILMKRKPAKNVISVTTRMRETPARERNSLRETRKK